MVATEEDFEVTFWRQYARAAGFLNLFIVVIDTAYVVATWGSGLHRPLLLALNLAALVGTLAVVVIAPEVRIARSPYRDLVFCGWIVAGVAVVTLAVGLDGGVSSPLSWLFPLAILFTATVHRPALVMLAGVAGLVAFVGLAAGDGTLSAHAASVVVRALYLVALTYAAGTGAKFRWEHNYAQTELRRQLSLLADHDGLTGLLNHRAFHEHLRRTLATSARREEPTSLLLLDLDRFKTVNDTHGHLVGDEVLRGVAGVLTSELREGDVVARIGGEEFAVLLPGTAVDDATVIAERIRTAVQGLTTPVPVTVSVGVATAPATDIDGPELVQQADGALYLAKKQGRNQVCRLRVA